MDAKTLAKYLIGGPELLASAATGAVAEPIAGWGGILAKTQPGEDKSSETVEGIRDRLTYRPRSSATQELAGDIAGAVPGWVKALGAGYSELSDKAGEVSPALGAAVATLPAAAGTLVPYAGRVKALASNVPETPMNRQAGILRGLNYDEASLSPGVAALKQGGDAQSVWRDYGVGEMPGMPGKYFDEIDDSLAYIAPDANLEEFDSKLTDILKHREMYQKVPMMKDATHSPEYTGEGSWYPVYMRMGLNPSLSDPRSTALHEAQHGVAGLTRLPQGTSPSAEYYEAKALIDALNQKRSDVFKRSGIDETIANEVYADPNSPFASMIDVESPDWKELSKLNDEMFGAYETTNREFKKYHDNYGEALARMAEARRNMDKTARSISYPFDEETFRRHTRSNLSDVLRNFRGE